MKIKTNGKKINIESLPVSNEQIVYLPDTVGIKLPNNIKFIGESFAYSPLQSQKKGWYNLTRHYDKLKDYMLKEATRLKGNLIIQTDYHSLYTSIYNKSHLKCKIYYISPTELKLYSEYIDSLMISKYSHYYYVNIKSYCSARTETKVFYNDSLVGIINGSISPTKCNSLNLKFVEPGYVSFDSLKNCNDSTKIRIEKNENYLLLKHPMEKYYGGSDFNFFPSYRPNLSKTFVERITKSVYYYDLRK